jgi:hypothetical protein
MIHSHQQLPTHSIAMWRGQFWEDYSLAELGLVLHLNHPINSCSPDTSRCTIWVGDILGFCKVNICFAPLTNGNTKGRQLLRFGLFPCSDIAPRSAFTLAALKHFSLFGTLGKNSTHKYYAVLERLTMPGFPGDVPNRYQELALTHRKYSHLMNLKRLGKTYAPHPNPNFKDNMALQCVLCPHPGVNFNPAEVEEDERCVS